jgi:5-methylcytosine-specific restriction enzyme subunit McrC
MNVELEAWAQAPVSAEIATAVAGSPLAEVRLVGDRWHLAAGSSVGVSVGRGWELRVHPRIPIPKLLFLLAYAQDQRGWRADPASFGVERDLLSAVANGFSVHALRALERGLLRSYVTLEERRFDLRGRLRFAEQIARSPGLPTPLEVAFDEYTADVAENRLLKSATELLLRLPRLPAPSLARLHRVDALLDEVRIVRDPRQFEIPRITRLNARYEPALVLAKLILTHSSITALSGHVSSASFIFDMNRVFEDFVSTALREALRRHGGDVRFQASSHLDADPQPSLLIRPDITWWRDGRCLAVVDAKYKSIANASMPNADAYQMLAYCIAHRQRRGFLIYAHDAGERPRVHTIRHSGHVIDVRTLDVSLEPDAVLEQVEALAGELARSDAPLVSAA